MKIYEKIGYDIRLPIFIDGHNMKDLSQEDLEKAVNLPKDGFGVTHLEIFHNKNEDKLYCILEAPSEEAIWKHHESLGLKCEFVTKVQQTKTEKNIKDEKLVILGKPLIGKSALDTWLLSIFPRLAACFCFPFRRLFPRRGAFWHCGQK